ncbi:MULTISPECIES: ABC transporter permease [unclassified Lentimicrobium]|uniref:ABC transporter permease n=1 Tax=unclassified Lentimicrobium TaxID=2677434 RepID=UPI0015575165|nr:MULTISPECIES: ABC transporter permease [unclassified Lentimicrobium]NPD44175.1 ABC transporter permease [Lentimicrobium sp. S6]NPD84633.1 ABC transporter permease [Lentimicrobium sp. L6]
MWKTSFIQFLKIIQQNKFFTFLNLFGVSITIMIILIAAIKIESTIRPGGPEKNNDKMLFIKNEVVVAEQNMSMGGLNFTLVEDYLAKMKSPEAIAYSSQTPWSFFGENGVEEYELRNVNAGWWQVFDFEFVEGRGFNPEEVEQAASLIVIDEKVKNRFFQDQKTIGELIEISGKYYKVCGVIKEVPSNCMEAYANVFIPYSLLEGQERNLMQTGSYSIVFLAKDNQNKEEIIAEVEAVRRKILPLLEEGYELHLGGPDSALSYYLKGWERPDEYKGNTRAILIILAKFLLVLFLPALNLVSIQLIRIHERSEEIGVRKAFGATRVGLIKQILYENTLLTFLGAILGLVLAVTIVYGFESALKSALFSDAGNNVQIQLNYGLFLVSLFVSLVLSLLSGMIPALKMSRVEAIDVLKGGEL